MSSPIPHDHPVHLTSGPARDSLARTPRRFGLLLLAVATFILLPCSMARANDTAVGGIGGNIYPLTNADIRMDAETVQAVCYRDFAEYRVEFKFVNEGATQTLKLGFPFLVTAPDSMGSPPVAFRAWQDGRQLDVTLGRGVSQEDLIDGDDSLGYYLHEATFPPGETTIAVSYFAKPTVSAGNRFPQLAPPEIAGTDISGWDAKYNYWVHTGAGWKGTIGKTVVRFYLADDFMGWGVDAPLTTEGASEYRITWPDTYTKIDDRTYQWVYEDYEPSEDDDVQLAFDRPNYWFGPESDMPGIWGAMPVMERNGDEWWEDEESRQAGWQTIDLDPATAWDATSAASHSMRVSIIGDPNVEEFRVISGRNDSLGSFDEYGRPKTIRVTLSDGTRKTVELEDHPGLQRFAVAGTAEWARVEVLDSYPGSRSNQVFISEIGFGTESAPEFEEFTALMTQQAARPTGTPPDTTAPATSPPATSSPDAPPTTSVAGHGGPASETYPTRSAPKSSTPTSTAVAGASIAPQTDEAGRRLMWPAYLITAALLVTAAIVVVLIVRLLPEPPQS